MDATSSIDAINCLPDDLLATILSLLSTKQAISTSVLSKKWRYVYRLLNNLDFEGSVLLQDKQVRYVFSESFKNFVDQTLALQCDFPIKKFSLKCCFDTDINECQKTCMDRWISNVIERGVLEVELRLKYGIVQSLPPQLFASKTLVKLSLRLYLENLPSYVSLPSLKSLLIRETFIEDKDSLYVLLAGCPVLEELTVLNRDIPISSMSIKRLSIRYTYFYVGNNLSLDLPNLVYLDYSGYIMSEYPQVKLESLIEAKLDFDLTRFPGQDLTNLIMGIRNVKILHLSPNSVNAIYWCIKKGLIVPVFNNLVNLSFGSDNKQGWELLGILLKHSPKLANLTIKGLTDYTDDISTPLKQVKVLHVLSYCGTAEELKHLKSFLEQFECIELVQVDVKGKDDGIILQATKDLEMLPGVSVSSKCHVKVTSLK